MQAERFIFKQTQEASRKLFLKASRYLKTGLDSEFDTEFIRAFKPALAQGLLLADLQGRLQLRKRIPRPKQPATPGLIGGTNEALRLSLLTDAVEQYSLISPERLAQLAEKYNRKAFGILEGVSTHIETQLRDVIAQSIQAGEHIKKATGRLQEAFNNLGISSRNPFQLETIVRTHTQLAYSAAKWSEAQDPDIASILWGYEYNTVGDNRVREEHEPLDGTRLPKEHPFWSTFFPPNGWNCRCQAIEIFSEEPTVFPRSEPVADPTFNFNPGEALGTLVDPPLVFPR